MIVVENISKRIGRHQVLYGVSLGVKRGELLTIEGPSGSGKTTLLRLIAGFELPDKGRIIIDDIVVASDQLSLPPASRKLAMIFQDLALWPHMSVRRHLEFMIQGCGRQGDQGDVDFWLERVHMAERQERYPHELSGGERQRLAIARALCTKPDFLLMDEPFNNLDPDLRQELWDIIREIRADGTGIIHVSHERATDLEISDMVIQLHEGRIKESEI